MNENTLDDWFDEADAALHDDPADPAVTGAMAVSTSAVSAGSTSSAPSSKG